MKHLLSIFISLTALSGFSQSSKWHSTKPNTDLPTQVSFEKVQLPNNSIESVKEYIILNNEHLQQASTTLELDTLIESLSGLHYTFHQEYKGVEIYNSQVKINTNKNNTITSVFQTTFNTYSINSNSFPNEAKIISLLNKYQELKAYYITYLFNNEILTPTAIGVYIENGDQAFEIGIDNNGNIIHRKDLGMYLKAASDSLVSGTVFMPDPLTSANAEYAVANSGPNGDCTYSDFSDTNSDCLNDERDTVTFEAKYSGGVFSLSSAFVSITDHSVPNIAPTTSSTPEFYYLRADDGFEDVNAYYHIIQMQEHIQNLGFNNVVNYAIHIDTHGLNNQDNSTFQSAFTPPRISFGEGGVDDAEDTDVVIHEYGHAIMYSTAPGTNSGTERQALDEAIGDYFAASYSRNISDNFWDAVYTWDGHNEFWDGRWTTSSKHYPDDLQNNLYLDADIWSSTIMQIWGILGRDVTDQLMIESSFGYSSGMSMEDAATLFYQADIDLNGGVNFWPICNKFQARGLMNSCPNSVEEFNVELKSALINSEAFATGKENAIIRLNQFKAVKLNIYSTNGQILYSEAISSPEVVISPQNFKSGVYLIELLGEIGKETYKLVRL